MALKALLGDMPVYAWDVAGTGNFACAECGDGMYYRRAQRRGDGVTVVAHFAHRPLPTGQQRSCSISQGESEEHENGKETVRLSAPGHFWWLKDATGDVEHTLEKDDIKRRADVLFVLRDQQRVVFEIQFTKIPRREIAQRTLDYHRMHCHAIWCFPEKRDDLYRFCWSHFYCVGKLSDDGTQIDFHGNISPFRYRVPSLKRPFDAEYMPAVRSSEWKPPFELEQYIANRSVPPAPTSETPGNWLAFKRNIDNLFTEPEQIPITRNHTLIQPRETGPWASVPRDARSIVRAYINSENEKDREVALLFCEEYGLDYQAMRKVIMDEMIEQSYEIERKKYGTAISQRRAS